MLGIKPDIFSFTSDHFERILHHAEELICKGLAYVDNTPQEEMMKEREERKPSRNRDNCEGKGCVGRGGEGTGVGNNQACKDVVEMGVYR